MKHLFISNRNDHWSALRFVPLLVGLLAAAPGSGRGTLDPSAGKVDFRANRALPTIDLSKEKTNPAPKSERPIFSRPLPQTESKPGQLKSPTAESIGDALPLENPKQVMKSVQTIALFTLVSLVPVAVLMVTAFVRINIVLVLLRQALGSPQVPGNQVLTALALLMTALVMRPVGETVYNRAIEPYSQGKISWFEAYQAASRPVKAFMVEQIERTGHERYLWAIYDEVVSETPGRVEPKIYDDMPLRVVAPAFLLSEITTAIVIAFYLYLPFLVVDLVVSAVLSAMGLFMLPPSMVALPLKLILFVAADGWLHVATMLLRSFGPITSRF